MVDLKINCDKLPLADWYQRVTTQWLPFAGTGESLFIKSWYDAEPIDALENCDDLTADAVEPLMAIYELGFPGYQCIQNMETEHFEESDFYFYKSENDTNLRIGLNAQIEIYKHAEASGTIEGELEIYCDEVLEWSQSRNTTGTSSWASEFFNIDISGLENGWHYIKAKVKHTASYEIDFCWCGCCSALRTCNGHHCDICGNDGVIWGYSHVMYAIPEFEQIIIAKEYIRVENEVTA